MKRALRVPIDRVVAGERALDGETSSYVARVRRLVLGDLLTVFDPGAALEASAEIIAVDKHTVRVSVGAPRPASVVATRSITILQAVGKGDKMDAIARDATELGATCLVPVIAERSVRRPEASRVERWRRIVIEAARQSGRGDAPRVEEILDLASALPGFAPASGVAICFAPDGEATLGGALDRVAPGAPVTFAVGPEGGFSAAEIELARGAGYQAVSLGPIVLRTETVAAAALGALLARS